MDILTEKMSADAAYRVIQHAKASMIQSVYRRRRNQHYRVYVETTTFNQTRPSLYLNPRANWGCKATMPLGKALKTMLDSILTAKQDASTYKGKRPYTFKVILKRHFKRTGRTAPIISVTEKTKF